MLCREDDFEDDEQPSLIEKIVERAQNMAKNRRSFSYFKDNKKIRSLESFKKQRKEIRQTSNQRGGKEISKFKSKVEDGIPAKQISQFGTQSKLMSSIKNGFDTFGNDNSDNEEKKFSEFPEPEVKKTQSGFTNIQESSLDFESISKKMSIRKRDRAQSESDSHLDFSTERYSSPSKRFKMKQTSENSKENFELKKEGPVLQLNGSTSSSYFEEEEEPEEEEKEEAHPIKRTLSLPRIKILENKKELPKINEVEEEEPDVQLSKTNSKTSSGMSPQFSLSPEKNKTKPLKIIRENSSDMKEKELRESPYDDYFFYYYETYLDEAISKITKDITIKTATRGRSRSEI
uniref:Uncharacterized protein n=1 Tax=Euplotes crassus TaxID=5936 RepID=A0A7S3KGF9_EUPCR|mmetsp:Transcript_23151/g.23037  ORF Transcript_23151/g.23037 Transcript_23151/m.23037 type:complete len:346 (+) Transcript_23151:262-1299(+)